MLNAAKDATKNTSQLTVIWYAKPANQLFTAYQESGIAMIIAIRMSLVIPADNK